MCDGQLVAAAEEERFNRVKYAAGFPAAAIRYCLKAAGITLADIDHVAVPRNPWARTGTKLLYAVRMPRFVRERAKAWASFASIPEAFAQAFETNPTEIRAGFHRVEHHRAHLASAFFVSPFDRAALLSADGLGDFASTMWAAGEGNLMRIQGIEPGEPRRSRARPLARLSQSAPPALARPAWIAGTRSRPAKARRFFA